MVVNGLESFMEYSGVCQRIYIRSAAKRHMHLNPAGSPVIVVDTMACLNYFYAGLPWVLGGQMKEYEARIRHFVDQFHELGIKLVFFFDGAICDFKLDEWKRQRYETVERLGVLFDRLSSGEFLNDVESTSDLMTPPGLSWFTSVIVKSLGCEVISSVAECDEEVANYYWSKKCVAVFSQDSNFAIFNVRYWSIKYFDVDSMSTYEYNRNKLSQVLNFPRSRLPLFASLMGNDIISPDSLLDFHTRIRDGESGPTALFVAEYIRAIIPENIPAKEIKQRLPELAKVVFNDENKRTLLETSMESYRGNRTLPTERNFVPFGNYENWTPILLRAFSLHRTNVHEGFFNIVFLQNYFSGNCLEDYRNNDLPTSRECLQRLRKTIYGLLLGEKPSPFEYAEVKELIIAGPGSVDYFTTVQALPAQVIRPKLLDLWCIRDDSMSPESRIDVLCTSVGFFQHSLFHRVPDQYRLLFLTLAYLVLEERINVERWEVEAVVATAVSLPHYSACDLSELDVQSVNVRGIRLYNLILRTSSLVRLLNFCLGHPIPSKFTLPTYYQDGQLFHLLYQYAEVNSSIKGYYLEEETKDHFDLVMGALYPQALSAQDLSAHQDLSAQDLSAQDLNAQALSAQDLSTQDLRTQDLSAQDLNAHDLSAQALSESTEIPPSNATQCTDDS